MKREAEKRMLAWLSGGLVKLLASRKVDPFYITYLAFSTSILAGVSYAAAKFSSTLVVIGGFLLLTSGFLDAIDGELARVLGRVSKLGGYVDSILDKVAESSIALGITYSGLAQPLVIVFFLATSLLVSYSRSRAEQLGVQLAGVGIAERAERMVILSTSSFLFPVEPRAISYGLMLIAALSTLTVVQRFIHAWRRLSVG